MAAPPPRVAGLVLAAGAGRRYGGPKALAELDGTLFVDRATTVLAAAGCHPVLAVLGAAAEEVLARARLTGVTPVHNPDWPTGMGSSLRAGFAALPTDVDAVVVLPVDLPGITAEAVRRVLAHASPAALAAATFHGRRGHPVLFGRAHWAGAAASATGDAGARAYLAAHPPLPIPCEDVAEGSDVDTRNPLG
ncbi:nucleotidyltransferase family protein [Crossiella sp. CA-258035]|uniref:nucleotidyltransferase family protein n=1 Tax=Crossiella sp. CA-258035 TaxID=2981138 RepID=UPI0024BD3760|nr:nucleotidyltransferase family protein [Crossiella sp. CA-258035]WHT17736.1 nucleotidyltransferase family protein [Crossiella sp. CA-258035]